MRVLLGLIIVPFRNQKITATIQHRQQAGVSVIFIVSQALLGLMQFAYHQLSLIQVLHICAACSIEIVDLSQVVWPGVYHGSDSNQPLLEPDQDFQQIYRKPQDLPCQRPPQ